MKLLRIIILSSILFLSSYAHALDLRWVEVDVSLDKNGMASITYSVRYSAQGFNLHGFYFEGFSERPVFDYKNCKAIADNGKTYGLDIKRISSRKYDIVLANHEFYRGEITYIFHYYADLAQSGNLDYTKSEYGRLAVLHWSPVQWDESLEHMTVVIHYPIELTDNTVVNYDLEMFNFRTEKFMNQNYSIDYYGQKEDNKHFFTVRLHKERLSAKYHFMIQQYISSEYFSLREKPSAIISSLVKKDKRGFLAISLLGFFPVLYSLFIITRKHNSIIRAREGLKVVKWDGDEWVPPKIQVSSFRIKGKIAKLTDIEALLLIELPLSQIVAMMLKSLEEKKYIEITSEEPLQIKKLAYTTAPQDPYEDILFNAIDSNGKLIDSKIKTLFTTMVTNIEQKSWDCDLDASRAYYEKKFYMRPEERPKEEQEETFYPYRRYYRSYRTIGDEVERQVDTSSYSYSTFKTSEACYTGAFMQNFCHDACHSACHNACHSACHSACHGACHGACVSGGAH